MSDYQPDVMHSKGRRHDPAAFTSCTYIIVVSKRREIDSVCGLVEVLMSNGMALGWE